MIDPEAFIFRSAIIEDIPFLVETIIEAEKAGTETFPYTTIFGLNLEEVKAILTNILHEESDNCELSLSSYMVASYENRSVAAVSSWVEGLNGMSSVMLKGNLLNFFLPQQCIIRSAGLSHLLSQLYIEARRGSIQIGISYVSPEFRGFNLIGNLINHQIRRQMNMGFMIGEVFVQVFGNNISAIRAYERIGFSKMLTRVAHDQEIRLYLPDSVKILMKKDIDT